MNHSIDNEKLAADLSKAYSNLTVMLNSMDHIPGMNREIVDDARSTIAEQVEILLGALTGEEVWE